MFDNFCTDLISLFVNHLWSCDSCFVKLFVPILIVFFVIGLIIILINGVSDLLYKLFSNLFDRVRYKKRYDELSSRFGELSENFDNLHDEFADLLDKYLSLQKEYYHTCN